MRKPKRKSGAASLTAATDARETTRLFVLSTFLAATVFAVFGSTPNHQFLNYDDDDYVYANPRITGGLTFSGIAWAFTHFHADNWHPLTTISHMLDYQIYGLHPWGHHLTNVLLHATAAVLLFLALLKLTVGEAARSRRNFGVGFPQDANSAPTSSVEAKIQTRHGDRAPWLHDLIHRRS